jgi:large subunit ribosomal protein L4
MSVATYTKSGSKAQTPAKLDKNVFGLKVENHQLLKDAYNAYLANGRANLAKTKTRGEVSGGGRKPWRQKGTGRARFGSSRNPIWTGGGVAFGPRGNENYSRKLNVRTKRQALRQALTLAAESEKIIVVEDISATSVKTKDLAKYLAKIGADGRLVLVVETKNDDLQRAASNLANVEIIQSRYLNVFRVLNADKVVITKAALENLSDWLGGNK